MTPNLERAIKHFDYYDKLCAKSVFKRIGRPDEIANAVLFLASDSALTFQQPISLLTEAT